MSKLKKALVITSSVVTGISSISADNKIPAENYNQDKNLHPTEKVVENTRKEINQQTDYSLREEDIKNMGKALALADPEPEANPQESGPTKLYYRDKYGNRIELYPELREKLLTETEKNEIESKKKILMKLITRISVRLGIVLLSHNCCSTIGANGLNYSVRDGKRCTPLL